MHLLDPATLIRTYGAIGVLAIVFAETGLTLEIRHARRDRTPAIRGGAQS
jgi:hypothetical protein